MNFFKKNFLLFIIFFVTLHQFQFFSNFFIILKNDYTERMIKYSGYCENEGYGYFKYIKNEFKIEDNIKVKNFNNQPPIDGYFYNIKKENNLNKIILIGAKKINLQQYQELGFNISHSLNNCYYITR
tara:strand:+ start:117 stop:497 length:381 start_codon:yes stop_codon:yes gene_type:complete